MATEFKNAGLEFPSYPSIDSLKWSRKYRPDFPKHSLQFLREAFNIEANQAHRALDDVKILYAVFSQMTQDLSFETIIELLKGKKKIPDRMPFGKHQGKPLNDIPKTSIDWLVKNGALDKPENKELLEAFMKLDLIQA
jgi:DNA polymerase-3 subunit epsilon